MSADRMIAAGHDRPWADDDVQGTDIRSADRVEAALEILQHQAHRPILDNDARVRVARGHQCEERRRKVGLVGQPAMGALVGKIEVQPVEALARQRVHIFGQPRAVGGGAPAPYQRRPGEKRCERRSRRSIRFALRRVRRGCVGACCAGHAAGIITAR